MASLRSHSRSWWNDRDDAERRRLVVLVAILLALAVMLARVWYSDPTEPVLGLWILPIALIAATWGWRGGFVAAALATLGVVVWYELQAEVRIGPEGYATRAGVYFVVGVMIGAYATRLREHRDLLKAITDATPDIVFAKDASGHYRFVNPAAMKMMGITDPQEALGKRARDFFGDEIGARSRAREATAMDEMRFVTDEQPLTRRGRSHTLLVQTGPLLEGRAGLRGSFTISRDITERVEEEKRMAALARHFELSRDLMCTVDSDGHFSEVNDRWEELLGWSKEELLGAKFTDFVCPDDLKDTMHEAINLLRRGHGTPGFRNRFRTKTGSTRWLDWATISAPKSGIVYGSARDVSDLVEAERLKDEFFAVVSHELRTPLTSIIGYLEILLDDEPEGERRHFLEVIKRNASRLQRLVGDLLFAARIEAGHQVSIFEEEIDLARIAHQSFEAFLPRAAAEDIELTLDAPASLPTVGDGGRLAQALENLLTNALKFTPAGGHVAVAVRESAGLLTLEVADDGPGIPPESQEHLFERFYRAPHANIDQVQGVGLGLSIVAAIAEAHGGSVEFDSELGHGASFRIVLPAKTKPAIAASVETAVQ